MLSVLCVSVCMCWVGGKNIREVRVYVCELWERATVKLSGGVSIVDHEVGNSVAAWNSLLR